MKANEISILLAIIASTIVIYEFILRQNKRKNG